MRRIVDIRITPVSIALTQSAAMSTGPAHDRMTRTIVEVETDDGVVGLGEGKAGYWTEPVERRVAAAMIGADPADLDGIRRRCLPEHADHGTPILSVEREVFGGIEIALWDNLARTRDLPLHELLGGRARAVAPFVAYAFCFVPGATRTEDEIPAHAAAFATDLIERTGASIYEMKIGANTLACDIETILAVARALPSGVGLALDANLGLTMEDARELLHAVSDVDIVNVEEPVAELHGMNEIGREFGVPISTHCTGLDALTHLPHVTGIVIEIDTHGGIGAVRDFATKAARLGKRVWLRSGPEAGVMWAAMVHLGIALPELDRPGQCLIDIVDDDLVLGDVWERKDGAIAPPAAPGLGVELDRLAMAAAADAFQRLGPVSDFTVL